MFLINVLHFKFLPEQSGECLYAFEKVGRLVGRFLTLEMKVTIFIFIFPEALS